MHLSLVHATVKVYAGNNIAPLVTTTDLQHTIVFPIEVHIVVGLEQHVGEFGVGNPVGS